MTNLKPLPGRVLVEIREKYEHVTMTEQKYDTKTSGIFLRFIIDGRTLSDSERKTVRTFYDGLVNKIVFWEEYKDGAVIERDGKKYAFIKIEDLDGYEDVESE